MKVIKVRSFNPVTNEQVVSYFDWCENGGRMSRVSYYSAYAAGFCKTIEEAEAHAIELCQKGGLAPKSVESWDKWEG